MNDNNLRFVDFAMLVRRSVVCCIWPNLLEVLTCEEMKKRGWEMDDENYIF